MSAIPANELKRRGVSALNSALQAEGQAVISVRGRNSYVVMTLEKYNELRESELVQAAREAWEDYQAGRIVDRSIEDHMNRISSDV